MDPIIHDALFVMPSPPAYPSSSRVAQSLKTNTYLRKEERKGHKFKFVYQKLPSILIKLHFFVSILLEKSDVCESNERNLHSFTIKMFKLRRGK